MSVDYLLYESSVGYAIFKVAMQADTIGNRLKEVQTKMQDLALFGKMVDLVSFAPWKGHEQALENANDISEGIVSDYLQAVLEANLPKSGKKQRVTLGVSDKNLAASIKSIFANVECETADTSEVVMDLLRGIRVHAPKLLKQLQEGDQERAQLGLGHAYSRAKVKFSVQKNDNHIIQAIATLDHIDKAINTFSMRVREWYSWHFPELIRIVSANNQYPKVVLFIGDKSSLSDDHLHDLAALVDDDEAVARSIITAAKVSMGRDISAEDMESVLSFARRAAKLVEYRRNLHEYLIAKMGVVAPNLAALIGETVGARLISKAGSLTNLSKFAASTVQILGAEKALFRALKTKGNTPKYGLLYHSSFISRAGAKNKGRMSRFLANKCSIASRIDNFSESPTSRFGEALRGQVEERLNFYATGTAPAKNADVMRSAMDAVLNDINVVEPDSDEEMADGDHDSRKDKLSKTKSEGQATSGAVQVDMMDVDKPVEIVDGPVEIKIEKKAKKEKKDKKKDRLDGADGANGVDEKKKRKHGEADGEKREKKKKKKAEA